MRTIWKYPLALSDTQTISMPAGVVRYVAVQHGHLCLWAEVTPGAPENEHTIRIIGTGHPLDIDGGRKYLGSFQLNGGDLVFHVYEAFDTAERTRRPERNDQEERAGNLVDGRVPFSSADGNCWPPKAHPYWKG